MFRSHGLKSLQLPLNPSIQAQHQPHPKQPPTMAPPSQEQSIIATIQQARVLAAQAEDDSEPYKHKYAAAELLQQAADAAAACGHPADSSTTSTSGTATAARPEGAAHTAAPVAAAAAAAEFAARCQLERGLVLLETDLTAEGQAALEGALQHAWAPDDVPSLEAQQQAHNALAALWCDRSAHSTALQHLHQAAALYDRITHLGLERRQQQQPPSDTTSSSTSSASSAWQAPLYDAAQVQRSHTTTLFYLAQVHGHMGDKQRSASYCAATLNRQVAAGQADLNDWVQNCLQLSGYFLDGNAFALSQYCCAAVQQLLLQRHQEAQQQQQQQQQQDAGCEQDQHAGKDQADKQQQLQHESSQPPKQQQEAHDHQAATAAGGAADAPPAALLQAMQSLLDADVAANVCLAFAKRHLYCLVTSHECCVEGREPAFAFSSAADVPQVLRFDALPGLPQLDSLAWGRAALARDYEQAALLFRSALPWFRRALEHYALDGWATEHVNTLFEMSNAYRCLAGFERDPHKRCVLHRHRAKLLAPLEGQLSATHYPGLSRSISLELGNVFREVADIKAAARRQPGKVRAALQAAAAHYRLFLDSFRGDDGRLPDRVAAEMEPHYLSGMFSMARMLQGAAGGGGGAVATQDGGGSGAAGDAGAASLSCAASLLDSLVAYVARNEVADWQQQAAMAAELAGLLREKAALSQRAAAAAAASAVR